MSIRKNNFDDRVLGALFGFAIGDAMGATTEFMSAKQIRNTYESVTDIIGGGWLGLKAGQVTDDTQMSICVIDALMTKSGSFENNVSNNFIQWYQSNPPDVGGQCSKGIQYLMQSKRIPVEPNALGNGALMRALPCALYGDLELNKIQQRLTHNNSINEQCIEIYHNEIQTYLYDDKLQFHNQGTNDLMEPTGCVINSLNNALVYVAESHTFNECILNPVNNGGDADTIAAITGSLAGAKYGFSFIPQAWVSKLDLQVAIKLSFFAKFIINGQ